MVKRIIAVLMTILLSLGFPINSLACDKEQTDYYVVQIIFGDKASLYGSNEKTKMLLNALYICSEQSDNQGEAELQFLKSKNVKSVPRNISEINIKGADLEKYSHQYWSYEYSAGKEVQNKRKKLLRNSVNEVFDFGLYYNLFGSDTGKCNSFAALLYYSHILADYLAGYPENVEDSIKGELKHLTNSHDAIYEYQNNVPSFPDSIKLTTQPSYWYSQEDGNNKCGEAFAVLYGKALETIGYRDSTSDIFPSGWNNSDASDIFQKSHLIAHSLGGSEELSNLFTGTKYLNNTLMKPREMEVKNYLQSHKDNHVLYRVTPKYVGNNMVPSGVQIEARSVEDNTISFNVYCYNIQPGYVIDYSNGTFSKSKLSEKDNGMIPFVALNANDNHPDLIFEIEKYSKELFEGEKDDMSYNLLISGLRDVGIKARSIVNKNGKNKDIELKECANNLYELLRNNVSNLLFRESFMKSAFN